MYLKTTDLEKNYFLLSMSEDIVVALAVRCTFIQNILQTSVLQARIRVVLWCTTDKIE